MLHTIEVIALCIIALACLPAALKVVNQLIAEMTGIAVVVAVIAAVVLGGGLILSPFIALVIARDMEPGPARWWIFGYSVVSFVILTLVAFVLGRRAELANGSPESSAEPHGGVTSKEQAQKTRRRALEMAIAKEGRFARSVRPILFGVLIAAISPIAMIPGFILSIVLFSALGRTNDESQPYVMIVGALLSAPPFGLWARWMWRRNVLSEERRAALLASTKTESAPKRFEAVEPTNPNPSGT